MRLARREARKEKGLLRQSEVGGRLEAVVVPKIPSRLTVLNPDKENVTEYVPGRRSTMLYRPAPAVIAVRVFSISAGLAASTVTPGSTAPDESCTSPEILACAEANAGRQRMPAAITRSSALARRIR